MQLNRPLLTYGTSPHLLQTTFAPRATGLFASQMLLAPQFLMDTNFNGVVLDEFATWGWRGTGAMGLLLSAFIYKVDAEKFLPMIAATNIFVGGAFPIYAQIFFNNTRPEHWLATTGVAGLSIWSIAKVFSSKNKSE